jgi:hypothetical protein
MQHKTFAGFTIRPDTAKRSRVGITGKGIFHIKSIIAEIGGVTPMTDRCPISEVSPRDRFAAMQEVAGTGPLAAVMLAAIDDSGRTLRDLTVMGEDSDPYRLDTPANHLEAQWFAAQVERFIAPGRQLAGLVDPVCVVSRAHKPLAIGLHHVPLVSASAVGPSLT